MDACGRLDRRLRYRHVERADLPKIAKLISCATLEMYSDAVTQPHEIYDESFLSLVQVDGYQRIVSAVFLCNYPNVLAVPQSDWEDWIVKHYGLENVTKQNSLFIHLLVWDKALGYSKDLLKELFRAIFYTYSICLSVMIVRPPSITPVPAIEAEMLKVAPKNESDKAQVLYISKRHIYMPWISFRLAIEEDNDYVIQILHAQSTRLCEFYGQYYISEMMRHPDESRRLVVAEKSNSIVGVMGINRDVDLALLNDKFDLSALGGLRHHKAPNKVLLYNGVKGTEHLGDARDESSRIKSDLEIEENESFEHQAEREEGAESDEVGEPAAFTVELLGHQYPEDDLRSHGLITAGFECMPDLNYCIVLVPTDRPYFPFLDYFTQIPLRANKDFPMALYVTYRGMYQGVLTTREAVPSDYGSAACLLVGVSKAQTILSEFYQALHRKQTKSPYLPYVFMCNEVIVGLVIIRRCTEGEMAALRRAYRLEDLDRGSAPGRQAWIHRLVIVPAFSPQLAILLSNIITLAELRLLYHALAPSTDASLCICVMQPIEPRIRNWPQFQRFYQKQCDDSPFEELFSLFAMIPRYSLVHRETINCKVVVAGVSDCGLAFINALTSGYKHKDLRFSNVTLINSEGLSYESPDDRTVRMMKPFKGRHCKAYHHLAHGRVNYNLIRDSIVHIDRERKFIDLEGSTRLLYDYLVITCEEFFHPPKFTDNPQEAKDGVRVSDCSAPKDHIDTHEMTPSNCFLINSDVASAKCFSALRSITEDFSIQKSIVLNGNNIECYAALGALLDAGLDGSWITLIEPKPKGPERVFRDDRQIREAVAEAITASGVRVFAGREIVNWTFIESEDVIQELLLSDGEIVSCDALLSFHNIGPCLKTFRAISRAGFIFDGRLVIDAEFRTNDRYVFAAGLMTKYTKKLRMAAAPDHSYYSSVEVGEKLADTFIEIIMKNFKDYDEKGKRDMHVFEPELKPINYSFRRPLIVSCLLPGGYRYLSVCKPGIEAVRGFSGQAHAQDDVFTSGSCTADTGYFRLRLNQFHTVECITCFSKMDFDIQNIISLYGKHEAMLNDLRSRFLNGEILDFYAYFRQLWATALFSDNFEEFLEKCNHSCSGDIAIETTCEENLKNELENIDKISSKNREKILAEGLEKSCYLRGIEENLIEFIEHHEAEFPMYNTFEKERQILREIEDTPLIFPDYNSEEESEECKSSL